MIYEYALEPELVATWADRHVGRYFIEKFGLGQPRIVSGYPSKRQWKRLIRQALVGSSDLDQSRLAELLQRLSEKMVKRCACLWDDNATWLSNAEAEHDRLPFHAILARDNPRGFTHILVADELDDTTVLWSLPRGRTVPRIASEMATAVAGMLRGAEIVIFVDPHFGAGSERHRRPLIEFLRAVTDGRPVAPPKRIEVQSAEDGDTKPTAEFFRDQCHSRLPGSVPHGLRVEMIRLRQRVDGERLHNRYILTDLGGVMFGVGLDEGEAGDTDDIQLLDRAQYDERWRQYGSEAPAFDRPEPVIIIDGAG